MVSIITPVYNRVALFRETCKSVLSQTYADWEWIVVDDGSEEDVKKMLDEFNDPRIKYFRLPHSGKLPALHNFGIANSTGEFIILPDSDDLWKKNALESMVKMLKAEKNLGFVIAETELFRVEKIEYPSIYSNEQKSGSGKRFYKELMTDKLFVFFTSGILLRRSCLDRNGTFDEALHYGDKNFFTRLAFHFEAKITKDVLVSVRKHDLNVTASEGENAPAEESYKEEIYTINYFFMNNYIDAVFHKRMLGIYYFKLAEYYYRTRAYAKAKEAYSASLKRNKMNLKSNIKYFLSSVRK